MKEILQPDQLALDGKAAYQRGDFIAAAQVFEAACHGFGSAGDVINSAEMANNASVAFLRAGDAKAALQVVEGTSETFSRAGDIRRQAMALGNRAAALEALNRLDEAIVTYQQSAELLQQAGEDDLYLHVMQALSALQLRSGKQLQALSTMQAGLDGVRRLSPRQRFLKALLRIPFQLKR